MTEPDASDASGLVARASVGHGHGHGHGDSDGERLARLVAEQEGRSWSA